MTKTDQNAHFRRTPGVLSTESNGETILVKLADGRFFGLGAVGTLLWACLERPCALAQIMARLGEACVAVPEGADREVREFLEHLLAEGLIESAGAADETPAQPMRATGSPLVYTAPRLDRGTLRRAASGSTGSNDGGTAGSPIS